MPKCILEFDTYEDRDELQTALEAPKMSAFIWAFQNWLRDKLKYSGELCIDTQEAWDAWHQMKSEHNLQED